MLAEAVTCMCQGPDASVIMVGMNDSRIAAVHAGKAFLEVEASFSLSKTVKTFHSI